MKKALTKGISLALAVSMGLGLCACGRDGPAGAAASQKTVVTLLYYNDMDSFINLVESTYDDIDIQYEKSTPARFNSDGLRRLKNGHGMDLIMTASASEEMLPYATDLSAYAFSNKYDADVMDSVKADGKTMYLPFPSSYYGYLINETFVEDLGAALPTNNEELLSLLQLAQEKGIGTAEDGTVFGIDSTDGNTLGEVFIGMMVPDFLGSVAGEQWLQSFKGKTAKSDGTLNDKLTFFFRLCEEGLFDVARVNGSQVTADIVSHMREGSMMACFGSSYYLRQLAENNPNRYKYALLPFLSDTTNPGWALTMPTAYITINKQLTEPGSEAKLDACQRILALLSTPEGQRAVLNDTLTDASFLQEGAAPEQAPETGLEATIEAGYVYDTGRFQSDVVWKLGTSMVSVASGDISMDEALQSVDAYEYNGPAETEDDRTLVGGVATDLLMENYNCRKEETALGNLIADSVAEFADVPIAFVNGGGIRASLYEGDVVRSDLQAVVPFDNTIVLLDVTGQTILDMLNNSIQTIRYKNTAGGRFLQVSGIRYTIRVDKTTETDDVPAAATLVGASLADGTAIDPGQTYRIAVNNYMCGNAGYLDGTGDGYTMLNVFSDTAPLATGATLVEDTGKTYEDALAAYFANHESEEISAAVEGRITIEGN